MTKELENIRIGGFAKEWSHEEQHSFPQFNRLLKEAREHPINKAERDIAKLIDLGPSFHS
jgi:ketol-acid reductoisomerase